MDRSLFLKEKRRAVEERMDALWAPIYDDNWGASISPTHLDFIGRFLDLLHSNSRVLDAACGTGKYWPLLLAKGHTVVGIDQSQGMLDRARYKFPEVHVEKIGMQELQYREAFDGLICMDAMEMVFPEDWPLVLANLHRALKPHAPVYLTVEMADEDETEKTFLAGRQLGFPVVYGEWAHEGGYHYYPAVDQVETWLSQAGFTLLQEGEGDDYYHLIVRR